MMRLPLITWLPTTVRPSLPSVTTTLTAATLARREAARELGDRSGNVRPLLMEAVRVAGKRRGYAADVRSQRVELLGDGLRVHC